MNRKDFRPSNEYKSLSNEDRKQIKLHRVMKEYKDGTLKSNGKKVKNKKQALAIGYSEAKRENKNVKEIKSKNNKHQYKPYEKAYNKYKKEYGKNRVYPTLQRYANSRRQDKKDLEQHLKEQKEGQKNIDKVIKQKKMSKQEKYAYEMNSNPNKYREDSKRIAKTYHGFVIGRKLIDDDGKQKNFIYYPRTYHGKPPYMYKTKEQAINEWKKQQRNNKFPASDNNSVIFEYKPRSYLDRY